MSDCIFCKIIKGEIPAKPVYKDENIVAFHDISPKAPVHVLIVPVEHIDSLIKTEGKHEKMLGKLMIRVSLIAKQLGIDKDGYKIVINNGRGAGQIVDHLHLHLLGGWGKISGWKV